MFKKRDRWRPWKNAPKGWYDARVVLDNTDANEGPRAELNGYIPEVVHMIGQLLYALGKFVSHVEEKDEDEVDRILLDIVEAAIKDEREQVKKEIKKKPKKRKFKGRMKVDGELTGISELLSFYPPID